jgi:serine phosphatase RsbU (regulator of sigma subunit)
VGETEAVFRSDHELAEELRNFEQIVGVINPSPDTIPEMEGVEIHGESIPLRGVVGGDHVLYVDFKRRYDLDSRIADAEAEERTEIARNLRLNKRRAGILVADVSGHRVTDAVIAGMLHQCFLLGVRYELDTFGEITTNLFEQLNTRFFKSTSINKYLTMIYGEISDDGRFRFISAAHQPPLVFSREYRKIMQISKDRTVSFPPLGMLPTSDDRDRKDTKLFGYKKRYTVNELNLLGAGDVLLLYTDGLSDHAEGRFVATDLERCLAESVDQSAKELCSTLRTSMMQCGPPADDISFVVIKKR